MTEVKMTASGFTPKNDALTLKDKTDAKETSKLSSTEAQALDNLKSGASGAKDSYIGPINLAHFCKKPSRGQVRIAAYAAFAGAFCWQTAAPLAATKDPRYQLHKDRLQAVSDGYARALGIKPVKLIIHNSWPLSNRYQGLDYPQLGFANVISLGKNAIDEDSEVEQNCWVAHEIAHFCEKNRDCLLPSHFETFSIVEMPWQRELKADYIGSLLCGKKDFIETMDLGRQREEKKSWFGTWITPAKDHLLQYVESHPSFNQRAKNILQCSPEYYPQGSKLVFPSAIAASAVISASIFWKFYH